MNQSESLYQLMQQGPSQVYSWIQNAWKEQGSAPERFNWLGLAEASAREARLENTSKSSKLEWAKVSLSVYDYLISQAPSAERFLLEYSEMNLLAYLISELGADSHNPILDPDRIVKWFFQNLNITFEEAERKSAGWKELNKEEILELRQIKNRLSIIGMLSKSNQLRPTEELQAWLSLRDKLP